MKTRQRIFWSLALLAVLFTCLWIYTGQQALSEDDPDIDNDTEQVSEDIATGIAVPFQLCSGGFVFTVFALLAWRNGAGLANERRHQETLAAMQQQPPIGQSG